MFSIEHSTSTEFASIDQFEAAETGNLAWFQHHKAAGTLPDLMLASMDGYYVHELATSNGHLAVVRYLIEESDRFIDTTADTNYALRIAAAHGHLSIIRYLIEESDQPIDIAVQNNYAIRHAARNGHLSVVRYLIEESGQPINITAWDNGALKFATENDHTDVIQYLETVIPIIEAVGIEVFQSLGLELAREALQDHLFTTSKNASLKGRI
jgi:hypothetical protein